MAGRDRSRTPRGAAQNTDEITSLIFQREQARQTNDFTQADQIRDQLAAMGVTLMDKQHQWRAADGRLGKIPSWSDMEGGGPSSVTFGGAQGSDPPGVAQVKGLVHRREQARANKDFALGDQLREELKGLGVELFDKEKLWRGKDGASGVIIGYQSNAGPTNLEVETLITQREKARQNNDWGTADMIRDELKQFGVSIHDKEKSWVSADGRSGAVPLYGGGGFAPQAVPMHVPATMPAQGPYGGVQLGVQQQIMNLALQASQNPSTAQRALAALRQAVQGAPLAVAALPPRMPQPGPPPRGRQVPVAPAPLAIQRGGKGGHLPEVAEALSFCAQAGNRSVSEEEIMWVVEVREKQRKNSDFASADALRDGLKQCGVELHQKEQRWTTTDGRGGEIPSWQALSGAV